MPRTAAVVLALGLVATPFAGFGGSATATTAPALPTVAGTAPLLLRGVVDSGVAAGSARQRVVLALKMQHAPELTQLLADQQRPGSAQYRQWLSPAQFAARFAPSSSTVAEARGWAQRAGLTVTEVSSNHTLVTIEGTRAALGRAFHVQLRAKKVLGSGYVTPDRAATLPAALRSATAAVLGLTTYNPATQPHRLASSSYQPYGSASYGPKDFNTIYHAPATTTGTGQSVAVITSGNLTGVAKDLATFQARNGLPRVPLTVVQTTKTSADTSGATEYDLDTQYSTGFAPGVKTLLAYNSDTLGDIHPLNRFVTDRRARTASASYGGCELINAAVGSVAADDQVFKQAMAQGQTMWVSSGDEGSSCSLLINTGTPAGIPDTEYPSSSPYVVAVGGTTLTGQSTQPTREITWIGGGGGYSTVEPAPPWQASNGEFVRAVGRGVPDVSLDADPNSGFTVVVTGKDTTIGGTSASAPAWNGIWARVLQRHPSLGFAAPVLYRTKAGTLTDITVGSNGLFAATPGYDLTTGLGTADITRLVASLR